MEILKNKIAAFKAYWAHLSIREKRLLTAGAALLGILILYWGIWSPYRSTREELTRTLPQLRKQVLEMHQQEEQVRQLKQQNLVVNISPEKMKNTIENSLREANLNNYISDVVDDGAGNISIFADEIPFARWLKWNDQIVKQLGIGVTKVKVSSKGEGIVQVEETLRSFSAE